MLLKKNRILRSLFPKVLTKGKTFSSSNMYMRVAYLNERLRESRFSFVVSKKVVKKAVSRNKLRRIGYNVVQKKITNIHKGFLVVFFFKKNILKLSKRSIEQEIIFLLKKANLLK